MGHRTFDYVIVGAGSADIDHLAGRLRIVVHDLEHHRGGQESVCLQVHLHGPSAPEPVVAMGWVPQSQRQCKRPWAECPRASCRRCPAGLLQEEVDLASPMIKRYRPQ